MPSVKLQRDHDVRIYMVLEDPFRATNPYDWLYQNAIRKYRAELQPPPT
jgi:hypothetical protein